VRPEVSPHGLVDFELCPWRFCLKSAALLPGGFGGRLEGDGVAGLRGQVVHRVLELGVRDEAEVEEVLLAEAAGWEGNSLARLREEVWRNLRHVWESKEYAAWIAGEHYRELGFEVVLEEAVLRGQIDLLVRDKAGWLVVDYKTTEYPQEGKEGYILQLGCYCLAASRILQEKVTRACLFFSHFPQIEYFSFTEPEERGLLAKINHMADCLRRYHFPRRPGAHCAACWVGLSTGCTVPRE